MRYECTKHFDGIFSWHRDQGALCPLCDLEIFNSSDLIHQDELDELQADLEREQEITGEQEIQIERIGDKLSALEERYADAQDELTKIREQLKGK